MLFLKLLAAACLMVAVTNLGASPISIDPANKLQPELVKAFEGKPDDARARALVSLEADQPPGLDRAAAIAAAQMRVIGAFKAENNGAGLAVLTRYRTLFGFSAELTRGQVRALANRNDVVFIEEMPVHQKLWPESHPLTDVDLAMQSGYDGTGAVIAIIDDGIDDQHPAFDGKLLGGYDFADFDSDPTIDCLNQSHGTAVAGVALGNGGGALGVASGAKFVFLKIQGSGICGSPSLDGDIVGAIDWAVANKELYGIDIISMSLGGGLYSSESSCDGSSSLYFNAIRNAVNANITVIAASGNDGMCDAMSRPACFSDVISVGAVYDDNLGNIGWCVSSGSCASKVRYPSCWAAFEDAYADNVIVYSNSASFLDVAAPSTCATTAATGGGVEDCFGGTSSATPFTSGTAALLVQAAGKDVLSPATVRDILIGTGNAVTDPKNGRVTPRVNGLAAAEEAATYGGGEPPNAAPQAAFSYGCSTLDCSFTDASTDSDGTIESWSWDFGDGVTSTAQNPSHSYAATGTYTVALTVTDNDGASDSASEAVTVTEPAQNQPPTAGFSSSCPDLTCTFTDTSSDSDGTVVAWSWDFGDGATSTAQNPSHSYARTGIYNVELTVTDNAGDSDTATGSVEVNDPVAIDVDLVGTADVSRNKWTAIVVDNIGNTLQGTWSESGAASCSGNTCTLSGLNVRKTTSVTFTETITGNGESIVINQP